MLWVLNMGVTNILCQFIPRNDKQDEQVEGANQTGGTAPEWSQSPESNFSLSQELIQPM